MYYTTLPNTDLKVSKQCLGTMTFGNQNTEAESHAILDAAVNLGVNFIDTAEMYPVPCAQDTQGNTEIIVGSWLKNKRREDFIIASKMNSFNPYIPWVRNGESSFKKAHIMEALDGSLKRLGTDYIDLYQLHWPDRNTIFFGESQFNPDREHWFPNTPIPDVLETLGDAIKAGKIRHIGISNENSWGLCQFTNYAKQLNLTKIATIQNSYSLVNRSFEHELHEACFREGVGLLAYSPLSFGTLTGKYIEDPKVRGRLNLFPEDWSPRFFRPPAMAAVKSYYELAKKYNITATQLALSWAYSRQFITSTIIGGTSVEHIEYNLKVSNSLITTELEQEINDLYSVHGDPAR
jgi:aryl-alcohol dehydrogenase-like predicted oxidoreductase